MIDVNTFFYKDRTTSTQEIEEFFSKVRDQAANKNFVDKAEGVIFIAEDLFFYKNNYLPDSPENMSPILLSVLQDEDSLDEKTSATGPNGLIVMVLGEKPFKALPHFWRVDLLRKVLPTHIIGGDDTFLYIDGEVATIDMFLDLGICVFRLQSLVSSKIDLESFSKDLLTELTNTLEYE